MWALLRIRVTIKTLGLSKADWKPSVFASQFFMISKVSIRKAKPMKMIKLWKDFMLLKYVEVSTWRFKQMYIHGKFVNLYFFRRSKHMFFIVLDENDQNNWHNFQRHAFNLKFETGCISHNLLSYFFTQRKIFKNWNKYFEYRHIGTHRTYLF